MKVGDKIKIRDYSYGFGVYGGKFCSTGYIKFAGVLTVIRTGLYAMKNADGTTHGEFYQQNDLLVTDGKGNFWFVQSRFCELVDKEVKVRYICDGKDVTSSISEETKRNLTCSSR